VKCIARPIAAMPGPPFIAAAPQSADATPRKTSAGARPVWIQAWRHAAVMSRTPQSSQPARIAWRVVTCPRDAIVLDGTAEAMPEESTLCRPHGSSTGVRLSFRWVVLARGHL
jgi:hypothetical protein